MIRQTQNETVVARGTIMLQKTIEKVNYLQCFSVLVHKTTDISTTEQMDLRL